MAKLNQLSPDLEVLCYTEDTELLRPGHTFTLLDIVGVDEVDGEKRRGDDRVPSVKIGNSDLSERMVFLEITSDF